MPRRSEAHPLALQVGQRICDLRVEKKLSLARLAEKAGVSKGHLSGVERGLAIITLVTIGKLAKALEVELFDILTLPETSRRAASVETERLKSLGLAGAQERESPPPRQLRRRAP